MTKRIKLIIYVSLLISLILWFAIAFATGQWNTIWTLSKEICKLQIQAAYLAYPLYAMLLVAFITFMVKEED